MTLSSADSEHRERVASDGSYERAACPPDCPQADTRPQRAPQGAGAVPFLRQFGHLGAARIGARLIEVVPWHHLY
jgi:hypothetical protein